MAYPDQFCDEYSRDIEPMKDGHGDNYYYQLAANIRKIKGAGGKTSIGLRKARVNMSE